MNESLTPNRLKLQELAAIINYSEFGLLEQKYVRKLIAEIECLQSEVSEALQASDNAIKQTVIHSNRITELEAENLKQRQTIERFLALTTIL